MRQTTKSKNQNCREVEGTAESDRVSGGDSRGCGETDYVMDQIRNITGSLFFFLGIA